jgi:hypothetical protein
MSTFDQAQITRGGEARPGVGEILRAWGRTLVVEMTVSSLVAFGAYRAFDFDLLWIVAVPLLVGGIGMASAVTRH